jgi:hypothetical protein
MIVDKDVDRGMKRWNQLRAQLAEAITAKAHLEIVRICDEIISFAEANRTIRVVEFLFHKRAARALAARGCLSEALVRIEQAISECKHYRATARLAKPDDFLRDVVALERLRDRWRKSGALPEP